MLARLSQKGKNTELATEYYQKALIEDPWLWEAFTSLCDTGQLPISWNRKTQADPKATHHHQNPYFQIHQLYLLLDPRQLEHPDLLLYPQIQCLEAQPLKCHFCQNELN